MSADSRFHSVRKCPLKSRLQGKYSNFTSKNYVNQDTFVYVNAGIVHSFIIMNIEIAYPFVGTSEHSQ